MSESISEVVRTAPERIYLQIASEAHYNSEPFPDYHDGITWCHESVGGCEVAYVRADLADQLRQRVAELEAIASAAPAAETKSPFNPDDYSHPMDKKLARQVNALLAQEAAQATLTEENERLRQQVAELTRQNQSLLAENIRLVPRDQYNKALSRIAELEALVTTPAEAGDSGPASEWDVVYRRNALDYLGYCYGSHPPADLPARCNLTPFHRQPDFALAALRDIAYSTNLTATPAQFVAELQRVAKAALGHAAPTAQAGATIEQRAAKWMRDGHFGLSSLAIHDRMMGFDPGSRGYSHPHDPADLNRCLLLLELIPEWKSRIGEMAACSEEWKRLVEHWDLIVTTFLGEVGLNWHKGACLYATETYNLMQIVLR